MSTPLRRVCMGAVFLAAVTVLAVVGYRLAGWGWLDAIYMVVITVATVGYGEVSHLSPGEQVLTMGVILFGISAAVFTLGGFIQMAMEGEIERTLSRGRATRAIERLENHVVVCGFGRIGQILAHELKDEEHAFVVIDSHPVAVAEAESMGYLALLGDATEEQILVAAGVSKARCVVTALPNDAASVFITLTARNLNRDTQIIARGEYQTTEKKLYQAGANRVVLPAAIGALRMAAMITRPSTIELLELVAGQSVLDVEVDEITVSPASPLCGKTIRNVEARKNHGLLIVARKSHGQMTFNPSAEVVFEAGDTIMVMGRREDIERFQREFKL